MNQNNFPLALHSYNIISLRRDRPHSGVAKTACRVLAAGIAAMLLMLTAQATLAGSATWQFAPPGGNWNSVANWSPNTVPNGAADTATFALSNRTAVGITDSTVVNRIILSFGADPFTITAFPSFGVIITGTGITNNSGITQNFVTAVNGAGNPGYISFVSSATAGSLTAFTNTGGLVSGAFGGATSFSDTATAGHGTFTNNGGTAGGAFGGGTVFDVTSRAGNGTFINNGGTVSNTIDSGGKTEFRATATAGSGVFTNNGGTASSAGGGQTEFNTSSTAGNGAFTTNGGAVSGDSGGSTLFFNTATAGHGTFTTNGGTADFLTVGSVEFADNSRAGNGTFTNTGGAVSDAFGGLAEFSDSATAANGTFTNHGGAVTDAAGAVTQFVNTSTAGNGIFTNNGGAVSDTFGGSTRFGDTATAGNAVITNHGGTVSGAGGGFTSFFDTSTAGNVTLIANGGLGGIEGGGIVFNDDSTGGTARVKIFGNGYLEITPHNAPGVTTGSIEGDGDVFLGARNLTVGSNNLSTTFSGAVQDGGGGTGGSLTKIGSGTLRFSGANLYTGPTTVNAGRLLANNSSGWGTGPGAVTANNGGSVLGGTGTISGPVTVNLGAALLGGNATTASGSLKVANNVTLSAGAIIQLALGPSGAHSTLTRTGGTWSFAPNQKFTFLDLGAQTGVYNNIITGLAGDPGGVASWTITNAGFTGTFSYDGAGNIDLNLTAAAGPVLQLTSAVSRKTHGGAGTFNINLPLTGEPGVECRSSGGDHALRFTFSNNVTSGNASVTTGTGTVSGTPSFAGKNMTVNLTGVADVQKITVTLSNVRDSLAQVLPDKKVSVNMLIGDTTASKTVNASDIGQTKGQSGVTVSAANFRNDVTVSGSVNASDIGLVKSRSGSGVP